MLIPADQVPPAPPHPPEDPRGRAGRDRQPEKLKSYTAEGREPPDRESHREGTHGGPERLQGEERSRWKVTGTRGEGRGMCQAGQPSPGQA